MLAKKQEGTGASNGYRFWIAIVLMVLPFYMKGQNDQAVNTNQKIADKYALASNEGLLEKVSRTTIDYASPETDDPLSHEFWSDDVRVHEAGASGEARQRPNIDVFVDNVAYIVFEDRTDDSVVLYQSQDKGASWRFLLRITNTDPLTFPDVAAGYVAAGYRVYVAYQVQDPAGSYVEVTTVNVEAGSAIATEIPPQPGGREQTEPVIWTENSPFFFSNVHIVCESTDLSSSDDINVYYMTNAFAPAWDGQTIMGGSTLLPAYTAPDGAYGKSGDQLYCVAYNETDQRLEMVSSSDEGATWSSETIVAPLTFLPGKDVDPMIAAANTSELQNVMIVCTMGSRFDGDNIAYTYSTDQGTSWTNLIYLSGFTDADEFAATLAVSAFGDSWHLAYSSNSNVYYSSRPQDLSSGWTTIASPVNEQGAAGNTRALKGIAATPFSDEPLITWTDSRSTIAAREIYTDMNLAPQVVEPLELIDYAIEDDDIFGSGNDDGVLNPGEVVRLFLDIANVDTVPAYRPFAILSSASPYVTLADTIAYFNEISAGDTLFPAGGFVVEILADAPAGHQIDFELTLEADNGGPFGPYQFSEIVIGQNGCSGTISAAVAGEDSVDEDSEFTVDIIVDMRAADPADNLLGSFTATVSYDPLLVDYLSTSLNANFTGAVNDSSGLLTFNGVNTNGSADEVTVASLNFNVLGDVDETAVFDLEFSALATAGGFNSILECLAPPADLTARIVPACRKGDINADGFCNSTDALILLAHDAGNPIDPFLTENIDKACGDLNGDGLTNSTDALILLSWDAGNVVPFQVCE